MGETQSPGRPPAATSNSSGVHQRATGRCAAGRPQVLAQRDDVDTYRPQVGQGAEHFVALLPHAEDQPGLGDEAGVLGPGQHSQTAGITRRGSHRALEPGHRLEVVVQNVGTGREDRSERSRRRPCSPR